MINHLYNPAQSIGKLMRIVSCENRWCMRYRLLFILLYICCVSAIQAGNIKFPYSILGGELSNSAATSIEDIREVMPRMKTIWSSGGIPQACMATTRLCSIIMVRGDNSSKWISLLRDKFRDNELMQILITVLLV